MTYMESSTNSDVSSSPLADDVDPLFAAPPLEELELLLPQPASRPPVMAIAMDTASAFLNFLFCISFSSFFVVFI